MTRKTHCKRGHPFTEENTLYRPNSRYFHRECLACRRIRQSWEFRRFNERKGQRRLGAIAKAEREARETPTTRWRCDCGRVAVGPRCECGTVPRWAAA